MWIFCTIGKITPSIKAVSHCKHLGQDPTASVNNPWTCACAFTHLVVALAVAWRASHVP